MKIDTTAQHTDAREAESAALLAPALPHENGVVVAEGRSARDVQRITAAAVKFESFFVAQMMKQMRQATAALADEQSAVKDQVNDSTLALAEQTVADSLAGHRAFGIADVLVRQLLPQPVSPVASDSNTLTRKNV